MPPAWFSWSPGTVLPTRLSLLLPDLFFPTQPPAAVPCCLNFFFHKVPSQWFPPYLLVDTVILTSCLTVLFPTLLCRPLEQHHHLTHMPFMHLFVYCLCTPQEERLLPVLSTALWNPWLLLVPPSSKTSWVHLRPVWMMAFSSEYHPYLSWQKKLLLEVSSVYVSLWNGHLDGTGNPIGPVGPGQTTF